MKSKVLLSVLRSVLLLSALALVLPWTAGAQGPPLPGHVRAAASTDAIFTYQGQLKKDGSLVTDTCGMRFSLLDDAGSSVTSSIERTVAVVDGLFTVTLAFDDSGVPFDGDSRQLGIEVQCTGDSGYVSLGQQPLTPVPYALYAYAAQATSLSAPDGDPADAVYVDNAGRVGLGTKDLVSTLTIHEGVPGLPQGVPGIVIGGGSESTWLWQGQDTTRRLVVGWSKMGLGLIETGAQVPLAILGGNVGVGTTSPSTKLEVKGDFRASGNAAIGGTVAAAGAVQTGTAFAKQDNSNYLVVVHSQSSGNSGLYWSSAGAPTPGFGVETLSLNTNSSPRLTINEAGNIGIGTTSPLAKLHIVGSMVLGGMGTNASLFFNDDGTGSSDLARISTETADTALDIIGPGGCPEGDCSARRVSVHNQLHVHGDVRSEGTTHTEYGYVKEDNSNYIAVVPGSGTAGNNGLYWSSGSAPEPGFGSDTLSLNTHSSPRLTIDQAGRVGVGTTSPSASLDVAGDLEVEGDLAVGGNVSWSSSSRTYRVYYLEASENTQEEMSLGPWDMCSVLGYEVTGDWGKCLINFNVDHYVDWQRPSGSVSFPNPSDGSLQPSWHFHVRAFPGTHPVRCAAICMNVGQ
jgi:hypothetical protein